MPRMTARQRQENERMAEGARLVGRWLEINTPDRSMLMPLTGLVNVKWEKCDYNDNGGELEIRFSDNDVDDVTVDASYATYVKVREAILGVGKVL